MKLESVKVRETSGKAASFLAMTSACSRSMRASPASRELERSHSRYGLQAICGIASAAVIERQ